MTDAERLRTGYAAWNRRDIDALLPLFHPEVEFRPAGIFPDFEPVYRGREGVRRFCETMLEAWESFDIHVERFEQAGDWLVADVHFRGVGRGSGAETELPFFHAWRLVDGLVVEYSAVRTREEALAVAGAAS